MNTPTPECEPAAKPRSKRIYVMWGVALAVLLALGLFCWLVVGPVLETRAVVERTGPVYLGHFFARSDGTIDPKIPPSGEISFMYPDIVNHEIANLGGPKAASWRLTTYLRLPRQLAPHRLKAIVMIGMCRTGTPETLRVLEAELASADSRICRAARQALWKIKSARRSVCDGRYAVLPWDTFPDFGKTKPVTFVEMVIKDGSGEIKLSYQDGTDCCIDVEVTAIDKALAFSYAFPAGTSTGYRGRDIVPLRRTKGFLEIHRRKKWVRFAKTLRDDERIPYPGWHRISSEAWGIGSDARDKP